VELTLVAPNINKGGTVGHWEKMFPTPTIMPPNSQYQVSWPLFSVSKTGWKGTIPRFPNQFPEEANGVKGNLEKGTRTFPQKPNQVAGKRDKTPGRPMPTQKAPCNNLLKEPIGLGIGKSHISNQNPGPFGQTLLPPFQWNHWKPGKDNGSKTR